MFQRWHKIKIAYTFYWKEQTQRLLSVVIRPEMKIWDQCLRYKGSILPKHDNPNKNLFFTLQADSNLAQGTKSPPLVRQALGPDSYCRFKTLVSAHRKAKTSARLPCEGEHGDPTREMLQSFLLELAARRWFQQFRPLENKMLDPIEDYLNRLDFNQLYPIYIETHRSECL